jgi:hypothetical protein
MSNISENNYNPMFNVIENTFNATMDRVEFELLATIKQVELINSILKNNPNINVSIISQYYLNQDKRWLARYMREKRQCEYNKDTRVYKTSENQVTTNYNTTINKVETKEKEIMNTIEVKENASINVIERDEKPIQNQVENTYKQNTNQTKTNLLLELNDYLMKDYKFSQTTIRIDSDVKKRMDNLANKYKSINKQLFYTLALEMFLEKFEN